VACLREDGQADHLLVIEVESSEIVHSTTNDECFLRIGDECRRLSFHQRQELLYDKGQAHFDATPVQGVGLEDLDESLLRDFAQALNHPDPTRVLNARNLINRRGELTAAAYLLFGRHPQDEFPEAYVRILRYLGTERGTGRRQQLTEDVRCEGPIPSVLGQAHLTIRRLQPARQVLGREGRFVREGLIPEDAWLEGLVNAVVHRSYNLGGDHIRVDVFNDRIEIESPGRFPGLVSVEDARAVTRFARNPRIARVCADLNFGQELGEGIRRMFEEMRIAGLEDPLYKQTPGSTVLTLSATTRLSTKLGRELPSYSRTIMEVIRSAGGISTGDIADAVGLSRPTTLKRLTVLQDAGLVEWVGKTSRDPRAYWRLKAE
jgi:ATP-dependent DNA helicase RecG